MVIFISYNWACQEIAIHVRDEFRSKHNSTKEVTTLMGIDDINFKDNLEKFMKRVEKADHTATVICPRYLKADNCMTELLKLYNSKSFQKKFLPLIVLDADIYDAESINKYIVFWQKKYLETFEMARELPVDKNKELWEMARFYNEVSGKIGSILRYIQTHLHIQIEKPSYDDNMNSEEKNVQRLKAFSRNTERLTPVFKHLGIL